MRKGLPYFIFIFSLLIAFSDGSAYGQGRESGGKKNDLPPVLRGQEGKINDLADAYCESSSSPEIYVNPGNLPDPGDYNSVVWDLYYYDGGGSKVYRNDLLNPVGSSPNNGIELDIAQISSEGLFNTFLVIEYSFSRGLGTFGGDFDYTIVRKDPTDFNLTIDNSEICLGETATLTLDGSESGYLYYLYRDGVLQNTVGRNGNGNPINFIQSSLPEGNYSYYVVAHVDDDDVDCETQMSGTPSLSVNSVPSPSPISTNDPVCQNISIELEDGNPESADYIYTWSGPGLDPAGETGHSITITDPSVIGTAGDYDYDLTIVDSSKPTGCSSTSTVTVTVLQRPTVVPTNDGPVCDGATNVGLYANPSGGSGDYSFSWTSNPAGFSSTDENPVLAAVTYGVDDIEYIVDVTDNITGCAASSSGSTTLIIHENPVVAIPEGDQTVCQAEDVSFSTNVTGSGSYSYQWYLDGNPIAGETSSSLTITGASLPAVGNHTVSLEVIDTSTSNNCSSTDSVQLTVNEKPEVEIVGPTEACAGDDISFDANLLSGPGAFPADYTISWTTPYGSESGDSFTINNVNDATHSGTYTLNITYDATGCTDQVQLDLTVNTVTPGISANPGTEVCQGTPVEFTATGGVNYAFSVDDGSGYVEVQALSADDTYGPVTLNNGDLVKVLVEDANGCQAESSPLTMIVNDLPVIDAIGNGGPYCIDDDPIQLSSSVSGGDISTSGSYSFNWSGPDGFSSVDEDPSFGPATIARAGIYTLTVTDDNGCIVTDDTEVVVNSLPSPSATNTGPVCGNGNNSIDLVGDPDGLVSYQWFDPDDNLLGSTQDLTLNNVFPDDSGIYTLRVTDGNSCENITTTEVIVNEIPVVGIGPDLVACENSDVTLMATISSTTTGPYTFSWYKDDGGGPVQVASGIGLDTYSLTSVDNTDAATYSVVVNDGNGCASASDAMILTIDPLPSVSPSGNDICASPDNDLLLEGGPDNPDYTYSWSGPGLTGAVSGQDVTVSDDATTGTPGVYTYTLTTQSTSTGCTNSATVDVEVFENPVVTIDPVAPVCDGGNFTVTANASGGSGDFNYSWIFTPDGGGASSGLPFTSNTFDIDPADLNDAGTYEVTVLDNITGCSTISNVLVIVNELPTVSVDDVATCEGSDATLTAVPAGGSGNYVNFIWSDAGGVISGENNNQLILTGSDVALTNNGATYNVTVEDDNGCVSTTDNMTLTVNENPTVQINSGDPDLDVCVGSNLTLTANVTGGAGSNSYVWELPNGTTQTGSSLVIDPVATADQGVYSVTVTDGVSCSAMAQVQVNVHEVTPTLTATASTICDGTSVTFTAGGGSQYEFLLNGTVQQALSNNDTWTSSSLADGDEVTARVVDTYGCEAVSAPITMTVNSNPVVALSVTSPNGDTPCIGQTVEFTATAGFVNYVYYVNGSEVQNSNNNIFTTDALSDGSVVYVVAESGAGCSGTSGNQTINFDPLPTAAINSDQTDDTACPNELVSFTASGGDTYEFLVDGISAGAATNDPTFTQNAPGTGSMEIGVVVTDGNNCSDTAYVDIFVSEVVPSLSASATTICIGNEVTFTAGGGDQFEFFLNGTSIAAPSGDNTYVTSTLADGDEVSVRVIDQYGCENTSAPVTMTVNDNPTVNLSFPGGTNEVCENSDLSVEATNGYSNYIFYVNGIEVQNGAGNIYTSNSFVNNDEVYVTASSGAGCTADSNPETIVVHSLPNASAVNSGPSCEGQTITLQGGDAGLSYEWFAPGDDPSVDLPISTDMDHDLTGVTLSQAGTYTLVVTDGNTCQNSATTDVVVNDLPIVDLGNDISVCEGTPNYDLTANISGGASPYNVEWEFEGTSVLSGQDETVYSISAVDNSFEGEYVVTVTDANNCVSVKDTVYLTVNPAPTVSISSDGSSNEYCDGTQVTLSAQGDDGVISGSDASGYEYVWYYEGTVIPGVSTQNYSFIGNNGNNDGLYEVVAIDDNGNGCSSAAQSLSVVIHQLPDATLDVDPAFFIEGTNVTFTAVAGYTSYEFQVNGSTVQAPGVDYVYQDATLQDGDEVTVIVTEDHGTVQCENSSTVIMNVFDSVDQPIVQVTDGEYCEGSTGATVEVTNPQQDVTYELVYDDGTPVAGYSQIVYDGSNSVSWSDVLDDNGGVSTPTTFRVKAFWATLTPDGDQLSDSFDITEHPLPNQYIMSVDGGSAESGITVSDCNSGSGYSIGLHDGWQSVDYTLLLNGTQVLEVKSGSGVTSAFTFDNSYSLVGEYTIIAQSSFGCTTDVIGAFTIEGEAVTIFDLTGEDNGLYCDGDADGVELILSGSETGLDYELILDGTPVDTITGDGNAISFGNYSDEGQFSVQVNTSSGCIYPMNGVVDVEMVDKPSSGVLTALPETYCIGGIGVNLQLSGQEEDHTYYLMHEGSVVATHVGDASGSDVNFLNDADGTEYFTSTGEYYVIAETNDLGCTSDPSDTVTISTTPLPENRPILGDTLFCEGGSVELIIESTQSGVEYQLIDVGADPDADYGSPQNGDGGALHFTVSDSSSYTISAVNTVTGCIRPAFEDTIIVDDLTAPDGSLDIIVDIVSVTGDVCGTEKAVITIQAPEEDISYFLYRESNSSPSSSVTVESPGLPNISFPDSIQDNNGDYFVMAESLAGCNVRIDDDDLTGIITVGSMANVGLTPVDSNICQGDSAVTISTSSSEAGVNYALRYASSGELYDSITQSDGSGNPIDFSPEVSTDSYFYLEANDGSGCLKVLDSIRIVFNPLPKAFELSGDATYCGSSQGASIGLTGSEFEVEYNLIKENEGLIDVREGKFSGDTILFNEVDSGVYTVFARNMHTGCTSSMKDTIKVSYSASGPNIPVIADEDTVSLCGEAYHEVLLESPGDGVTYHLFDSNNEQLDESLANSGSLESPFRIVETGEYTISASRNGACMSQSDTIWIEEGSIPLVNEFDYKSYVCATEGGYIRYDISEDFGGWDYSIITRDDLGNDVLYQTEEDAELTQNGDSLLWTINDSGEYFVSVSGCEKETSNKITIEIADPIAAPTLLADTFRYCHDFKKVDINVQGPGGNSIIYHLYAHDSLNELTELSPVYGGASNPVFEEVSEGQYLIRSEDLSNGCFSDYSDTVVVESHILPYSVTWDDLIGPIEINTKYMVGGDITLDLDLAVLDNNFTYVVKQDSPDSPVYNVGLDGEVAIDQRGDSYFTYGIYSSDCPSVKVTDDALTILEDSIDAKDVHLYLKEGENRDTITVQAEYPSFDEGYLEYFFAKSEDPDSVFSEVFIGDFTINRHTGLVTFDKAPSFYGSYGVEYVVRNTNYPERVDTAFIYVYVGNSDLSEDKSIFIPNAFSPNGDTKNEYFEIKSNNSITEESSLEVYNRWGTIVYRSDGKNYANDWDGTSNMSSMVSIGEDLPNGVYFYVYTITANVDGKIVNKKFNGYIELRR
ncbi:T9SS type B sorting domain-containing protein [Marinilabilia rubra]|uniref:Ig-like domain-containing protein n=1 Tax=Marinilabilia rubra TaxID=2162893 RepID=A0A2U2BCE5_9BACT|nr:gliding motility-associated C-terminal domain-containing protein [Marinilabilia rubra]PWE00744.1 hypothetical protein DDZ16_03890 [Marinilabilia rubra]